MINQQFFQVYLPLLVAFCLRVLNPDKGKITIYLLWKRQDMKGAHFNNNNNNNNEKDENFKTILDGTNLHGWKMCGPGRFDVIDNIIMSNGGMGLLWYKDRTFRDFVLKVHWKTSAKGDNSGVFVRFSDPDDDPWIAVNTGYEIQIYDGEPQDGNATHRTGAIYNFSPPSSYTSNEPGEWNIYEIHAIGQKYAVILNGTRITEFTGDRNVEGYIGLQNHDARSRVCFGKIAINEL